MSNTDNKDHIVSKSEFSEDVLDRYDNTDQTIFECVVASCEKFSVEYSDVLSYADADVRYLLDRDAVHLNLVKKKTLSSISQFLQ